MFLIEDGDYAFHEGELPQEVIPQEQHRQPDYAGVNKIVN